MNVKKDSLSSEMESLEAQLAGTLRPVVPRNDFVQRLRERVRLPEPGEIVSRLRDWNRLFIVFASVMSGMMLIITVARALYYLVGRRKTA